MPLSGAAKNLQTSTGIVNVSSAAAPSANQVLTATSPTTATWQTPTGGAAGWTLVENPDISGVNTYTTTAITGDTSKIYMLVIKLVFSTADRPRFRFNSITTAAYSGSVWETTSLSATNSTGREGTERAWLNENNSFKQFTIDSMIYARTAQPKQITGKTTGFTSGGTPVAADYMFGYTLNDSSTAITGFTIFSQNSNNFQTGSEYWLFKQQ